MHNTPNYITVNADPWPFRAGKVRLAGPGSLADSHLRRIQAVYDPRPEFEARVWVENKGSGDTDEEILEAFEYSLANGANPLLLKRFRKMILERMDDRIETP